MKTNHILSNQNGSVFILSFLLILLATAFTLIQIEIGFKITKKMKYRSRVYLCFKYLNLKTQGHIKKVNITNDVIAAAFVASKFPPTASAGSAALKAAKVVQNAFYLSYMKNLLKNQYCSIKMSSHYIKNYPYKLNMFFLLKRNPFGLSILKNKKWKTVLVSKIPLVSKWSVKSSLLWKYKLETKEIGLDYIRDLIMD